MDPREGACAAWFCPLLLFCRVVLPCLPCALGYGEETTSSSRLRQRGGYQCLCLPQVEHAKDTVLGVGRTDKTASEGTAPNVVCVATDGVRDRSSHHHYHARRCFRVG